MATPSMRTRCLHVPSHHSESNSDSGFRSVAIKWINSSGGDSTLSFFCLPCFASEGRSLVKETVCIHHSLNYPFLSHQSLQSAL